MTTSQLTVSAIRQHFESIGYAETASTSNMPLKPETAVEKRKKQPPKTRPKPTSSVMLAARCGNAVKSAGNIGAPSQSVAQNVVDLQPSVNDQCTARPADDACASMNDTSESESPTSIRTCEDSTVQSPPPANNLPCDDRSQTRQVSAAEPVSRDESESDVFDPSAEETAVPASSLPSDAAAPSAHDARVQATNSAEQTGVIAGLQLEGESAAQPDDDCEVTSQSEINEHSQTTAGLTCESRLAIDETSLTADKLSGTKSFTESTDNESSITDYTSETVMPQPNQLSDRPTLEQNVERSPVLKVLSNDETAIKSEEIDSESRGISEDISQQTRRPISLYPPEDTSLSCALSDTDVQPSLGSSANDNCTPATGLQSDRQALLRRNAQGQSPLTETTFNLRSVQNSHVVPSRKSYLVIKEFIGENFSFLDDNDLHDRAEMPESITDTDCGKEEEQSGTATRPDQANCAATEELCSQHSCDEQEETTSAEKTLKNDIRPRSSLRKSIILPNGEVLETIFNFLDDYDEQIIVHDFAADC